jgi:CRISPR-associated endonuclease Csn1
MKKILGLDLGTNSVGWALVNEAENEKELSSIIKLGVRVNPLTVDEVSNFNKAKGETPNQERTSKRGARRRWQRYKLRRQHLIDIFIKQGWITSDALLTEDGNNSTFETYRLRAKAATEEISLMEFARVLLMINKKRGYKSNRKVKGEESGAFVDGMEVARFLQIHHMTPGQYGLQLMNEGKTKLPAFYHSDLYAELLRVWNVQRVYYPQLLTDELFLKSATIRNLQTKKDLSNKKLHRSLPCQINHLS